ncbi:MAG: HD-GYP domain-containing protein [Desulfovibrionaceae bacterium]|nr:HD-GYP domain-containing protein [Desulfovibrionaceae bacterium]
MITKLATKDLAPGMRVVNLDLPWLANPFLYARDGVLASQEDIDRIILEGFLEVYVDTETPASGDVEEEIEEVIPHQKVEETFQDRLPPKVRLSEELPAARTLFDGSVRFARSLMLGLSKDKPIPVEEGARIVDDIFNSITRNCNALLGLVKLRRRDEYTYTHCINVCVLASLLSVQLGHKPSVTRKVGLAGLFHDIGKTHIPDAILNKSGPLSNEEFMVMKLHPELGLRHVQEQGLPPEVMSGISDHHEKLNGKGYPRGLKGDEISETARIITIVDIYDALTSRRVYKDPMLPHQALCLMYSMRGEELDERLLSHFIRTQGIYPVGSVVELSSGWRGVVTQICPEKPLAPQVTLVRSPLGRLKTGEVINLAEQSQVKITRVMTPGEAGVDPSLAIPGANSSTVQSYVSA